MATALPTADSPAPWRRLGGLGPRLVLSYVALVVLALGLLAGLLVGELDSFFLQQARGDLALRARLLADNINGHPELATAYLASGSQTLQVRVRLLNADGQVVLDSDRLVARQPPPAGSGLAPDAAVVTAPCVLGVLQLSEPLTYRAATLQAIRHDLLILALGAAAVAALLGLALGRRLTAPLRRLRTATERLRAGDLGVALPTRGADETADLSRSFNAMAGRLRESFATIAAERDRLRTFVADVSHELRTPITALRTFNDLLRQGAVTDPAVRDEFLAESAEQIERLDRLTANLLDLSKLESGLVAMARRPADLTQTVRDAVAATEAAADAKAIVVAVTTPAPPLIVTHDARRLEQAVANVLANAVKFSPPGSAIEVGVTRADAKAIVVVRDAGPGIAPRDLPHVFDRFYRGAEHTPGVSGSGLGLAIVKSIMEAHGGTVHIASVPGQGATVELALPITTPPDPVALVPTQ